VHHVCRSLSGAAAFAALALVTSACSLEMGDNQIYGEVTLAVRTYDPQGEQLSRDVRTGPGDQLVAALDQELDDPITVDGVEASDAASLLAAREARIGDVMLWREAPGDSVLAASGASPLGVRSAWRAGDVLLIAVDEGWVEVAISGQVPADSVDRILGTALVRVVRGEDLLADGEL
jgi:hypothetical protein